MKDETDTPTDQSAAPPAEATGSAVICDIIGCHEHATGEVQVGDEYIPLCEMHRKSEMDRLMPKWRPLPPNNTCVSDGPADGNDNKSSAEGPFAARNG